MKSLIHSLGFLGFAAAATALTACSALVGIKDLPSDGGLAAGDDTSDSDGGSRGDDTGDSGGSTFKGALFLGTWTVTSGSSTLTCPGSSPQSFTDVGGGVVITRGTQSDLLATTSRCALAYDVTSPTTMTLVANQSCSGTGTDNDGNQTNYTLKATGTFTLSGTNTGTTSFQGNETIVDPAESASEICSFVESDTYAKD